MVTNAPATVGPRARRPGLPTETFEALWGPSEAVGPAAEWRAAAFGHAVAAGLPTKHDESWKYTSLSAVAKTPWQWARSAAESAAESAAAHVMSERGADALPGCRFVFVDGVFSPALSQVGELPAGVQWVGLAAAHSGAPDGVAALQSFASTPVESLDALTAFVGAMARHGALLRIGAEVDQTTPLHLVHVSVASEPVFAPTAHLVAVEHGARASVVVHHLAAEGAGGLDASWLQVRLAENAEARVVQFAAAGGATASDAAGTWRHISRVDVRQQRASRFTSHVFSLGGALSRTEIQAQLQGEGTQTDLDGLYLLRNSDHLDHQTRIDHLEPHGDSSQLYKGILEGASRGVFAGKVFVAQKAQLTNANQQNQNLLLSRDAEVDTKPELEIYADDVKCAHGATVGALDADAVFYLRARGIDADAARNLLTYGFASEMVLRLPTAALQKWIGGQVLGWMPDSEALAHMFDSDLGDEG